MIVKNSLRAWGWVLLLLLLEPLSVHGTTIKPYTNLGEVAKSCQHVVLAKVLRNYEFRDGNITYNRSKLQILESLKGDLDPLSQVDVQRWERTIDGDHMVMWGDVELHDETTYLLFLDPNSNGTYRPICFSYYLHEEITRYGISYLVPSEHAKEFETLSSSDFETPAVYLKNDLMLELQKVLKDQKTWDMSTKRSDLTLNDFYPYRMRRSSGPGHCSFLTSGSVALRWEEFDDNPVSVRYIPDDTTGCPQANSLVQACVTSLNSNYPGVNLVDGGEIPYMANCFNFSAVGYNYSDWIDDNLSNGSRNIIVQYDDPCGEFTSLSGCSGVIAVGGVYNVGTHDWKGEDWRSGGYGYVILNEGAAACFCGSSNSELADILEHELTHALGLGHIGTEVGIANMNPGCCNDITNLDQGCADHSYLSSALLPIALESFSGQEQADGNLIRWQTAFELDVAEFVLERAQDESHPFIAIQRVESKGDTDIGNAYEVIDAVPPQKALYRLRSIDLDGEQDHSQIIVLERASATKTLVYPTQPKSQLFVQRAEPEAAPYSITSVSGGRVLAGEIGKGTSMIGVNRLPAGTYYLNIEGRGEVASSVHMFSKL